ncbi:MAG: hypothetical protein ACREQQ_18385 [Candidatus Binatia bacterium]
MQLARTFGVVVLLAVLHGAASADIYVWRDSTGVSHYVNDLQNVPAEYRKGAMPVAKDWARAAPPPAPAEPPPTPPAAAKPEAEGPTSSVRDVYEAAYAAGFQAAELADPPSSTTTVGPIVQNVQVLVPEPRFVSQALIPLPFFVDHRPRARKPIDERGPAHRRLPPASRAPHLESAAGPPPLGAAGPPPVRFER